MAHNETLIAQFLIRVYMYHSKRCPLWLEIMGVRGKVTNPPERPFYTDSNTLFFVSIALILMEILANFDHDR